MFVKRPHLCDERSMNETSSAIIPWNKMCNIISVIFCGKTIIIWFHWLLFPLDYFFLQNNDERSYEETSWFSLIVVCVSKSFLQKTMMNWAWIYEETIWCSLIVVPVSKSLLQKTQWWTSRDRRNCALGPTHLPPLFSFFGRCMTAGPWAMRLLGQFVWANSAVVDVLWSALHKQVPSPGLY